MSSSCGALVSLSRDLRVSFLNSIFVMMGAISIFVSPDAFAVKGDISRVGDATHLEFEGLTEWSYDLNRPAPGKISVFVPAFDVATELRLKSWSDNLIKGVEVKKEAPDGRFELIFTLAGKDVESFDYLTDEPSRLIIDFYKQANQTAEVPQVTTPAPAKIAKAQHPQIERGKKVGEYTQMKGKGAGRDPAGGEFLEVFQAQEDPAGDNNGFPMRGVFDAGDSDYGRFRIKNYEIDENSVIANRQNIYIKFPSLSMPVSEIDQMMQVMPEYVIKPGASEENKEARLVLHLYNKGRTGAFMKAYNYFINKYPHSKYDEIVRNLAAEHYFKKYRQDKDVKDFQKAEKAYRHLLEKYPESPLAERSHLLLSYGFLERGEAFSTIQSFQDFLKKFPESSKRDKAKMALAQSFIRLNKFDDAKKTYQDLMTTATNEESKVESAYRLGDVFVAQGKHKEAVAAYEDALKKYPQFEQIYPNAHYNLGESMFWMPRHEDSLDHFVKFLQRFPSHEYGGYAMTRIGELLEILGADRSKVMGAFLESYFRFKNSPGAKIARIRMLSQRMKGMKDKELRDSMAEMEEIVKESPLPRIAEFVNLMVADGHHRRGEFDKSIEKLVTYYQKNPTSTDLEFFKKRILRNISDSLVEKVNKGDYLGALKFNESYKKTWLRNQDRLDIPFHVGRAFEQAGVYPEAKKVYEKVLTRIQAIAGTQEEKERRVTEHLPTQDQVFLRLAKTATEAKEFAEAQNYLSRIKKFEDLAGDEKIQMVELQAGVSEERGQLAQAKKALTELTKAWSGEPNQLVSTYLKLSELSLKSDDKLEAEKAADKVLELAKDNEVKIEDLKRGYELKGEAQLAQGKELAAVETFTQLLAKDQDKKANAGIRFKAGDILYSRGDFKGAEDLWKEIDETGSPLFAQIAKEKMEHAKWQKDYKKYIQRIPAMSGMSKSPSSQPEMKQE